MFVRVYGEKLEDAFVDPRMVQVEQLLNDVGAESADYPAAQELLGRIHTGREKAQTELNARRELMRAANAPVQMPSRWAPSSPVAAGIAEVPDAGHEPASGMRSASLRMTSPIALVPGSRSSSAKEESTEG